MTTQQLTPEQIAALNDPAVLAAIAARQATLAQEAAAIPEHLRNAAAQAALTGIPMNAETASAYAQASGNAALASTQPPPPNDPTQLVFDENGRPMVALLRSIKDVAPVNEDSSLPLDDFVGRTVAILDVEFKATQYGDLAIFTVVEANGQEYKLRTTGGVVIRQLYAVKAADAFPIRAMINKYQGKAGGFFTLD